MSLPTTPGAWASRLTAIQRITIPEAERFPVPVAEVAKQVSGQLFPTEPIREVESVDLGFADGALLPISGPRPAWGIAYDSNIRSPGRIRFTIAHEVGHYFLHRHRFPDGKRCTSDDIIGRDGDVEREADTFAAALLMPLDDYRRQIPAREVVDVERLSACAERYGVSLVAATLRWLAYTELRAVLAISRDGYLLWSWSSEAALKTGAFIRTSKQPVELHVRSVAANAERHSAPREGEDLPPRVWFDEPTREMCVVSDQYDFAMSLLILGDARPRWERSSVDEEDDPVARPVDRFMRR